MIGVFAGRDVAIMAGATAANDLQMIHCERRGEHTGRMAILADTRRQYVRRVFTRRLHAVVAGDAIAGDIRVIENGRYPGAGVMAVVALFTRCDMGWRFTSGLHAVMAGTAIAGHRRVVHKCASVPCGSDVTIATLVGRHLVIGRLGRRAHDATGRMTARTGRLC